jgi:uncharacterized membrane protein YwzB
MYKFIISKHIDIKKNSIDEIVRLKKTFWKYSEISQKKFIKKNAAPQDIHLMIYFKKELIGYTFINFRNMLMKKKKLKIIVIDNILIKKNFRGILGFELLRNINSIIKKKKKVGVLIAEKKLIKFYQFFGWKIIKYKINMSPKKNKTLMTYNFKYKSRIDKINFDISS